MQRYSIIISALSLVLIVIFLSLYVGDTRKVGYVDNTRLLLDYNGYKEAQSDYEKKEAEWAKNLEELEKDLKASFIKYQSERESLSIERRKKEEEILNYKKNNLLEAKERYTENIQRENDRLMEEVSNQIEVYVERYAQEQGYELIVGITDQGNVLYSDKDKNITEELLIGLNGSYEGM